MSYKMMPTIHVREIEEALKEKYNREFDLRSSILGYPQNDCYIPLSFGDYPMKEEDKEYYPDDDTYVDDYNATCEYLLSLGITEQEVLIDVEW